MAASGLQEVGIGREAAPHRGFAVRLDVFQGPLDLLLRLIERAELPISAISLAMVTDQFLARLAGDDGLPRLEADAAADYVLVAAKLVLIKSRFLLPPDRTSVGDEDEAEAVDAAETLRRQLLDYQRFRTAAEALRARQEAGLRSWPRRAAPTAPAVAGLAPITPAALHAALLGALGRRLDLAPEEPQSRPRPTVEAYLVQLRKAVGSGRAVRFADCLAADAVLADIVAAFLATLELFRLREVEIDQDGLFGAIVLRAVQPTG